MWEPVSFFVFADRRTNPRLVERAHRLVGGSMARHASGNPWVVGLRPENSQSLPVAGGVRAVAVGPAVDCRAWCRPGIETHAVSELDALASEVGLHGHFVATGIDGVRVQGDLATSRQVFWSEAGGDVVASDSLGALRALVSADFDETTLALRLGSAMPILPLVRRTPWRGVTALDVGYWLQMPPQGHERIIRWWAPAREGTRSVAEASALVRSTLTTAVSDTIRARAPVSADLSGGLDSTSLCYVAASLTGDLITFRTSSADRWNDESRRARESAEHLGVPLTELEPLAHVSSGFDTRLPRNGAQVAEGPLAWSASQGYLDVLAPAIQAARSRVHLTGLGGDELFGPLPALFRSLWVQDGVRAIGWLRRLQLAQKLPLKPLVRGVLNCRSYGERLREVAAQVRSSHPGRPSDAYSWLPTPVLPSWATPRARELVADALSELDGDPWPMPVTPATHQMIESVVFQGNIVRQINAVYAEFGIEWTAPFVDRRVVELALQVRMRERLSDCVDKPMLAAAMRPLMPLDLFLKQGRGDFTTDIYEEHRRRRKELSRFFDESVLADHGLIDLPRLRPHLNAPSAADIGLIDLEAVVSAERWLRAADGCTPLSQPSAPGDQQLTEAAAGFPGGSGRTSDEGETWP